MFDFPSPATEGLTFSPSGGPQYVFTNGTWRMQGSTPLAIAAQARNRIVNPAMQISQENGSTEIGSPNAYWPADQWSVSAGGATNAKMLAMRISSMTPYGSVNRLRTRTNAVVVPAASEFVAWLQVIEGIKIADFQWGTANAKRAVLRFGFRGPAGTYSIGIRNSDATLGYAQAFTISAGQADIDTEQIFVIPGPTTGTFANDNAQGIRLYITLCSTSFLAASGSWTAGNIIGATGMTNSLPAGALFFLFDVGLYLDPQNTGIAPAWQMPDEADELIACQRYYHKIQPGLTAQTFGMAYQSSAADFRPSVPITVAMRVTPTVTVSAFGDFVCVGPTGNVPSAMNVVAGAGEAVTFQCVVTGGTVAAAGYLRSGTVNAAIYMNARM